MAIALLAILVCVPWAILNWPGADIFAIDLTTAYALGMVGAGMERGWRAQGLIVGFFTIATNLDFLGVAEQGIAGLLPKPQGSEVMDSRFPGTVSHAYQEREAQYNACLQQIEAQKARGWQVRKGWLDRPIAHPSATFITKVSNRDNAPVPGAEVSGRFLRTPNSRDSFEFIMPLHGLWELVLQARRGDDLLEVRADISVAPGQGPG